MWVWSGVSEASGKMNRDKMRSWQSPADRGGPPWTLPRRTPRPGTRVEAGWSSHCRQPAMLEPMLKTFPPSPIKAQVESIQDFQPYSTWARQDGLFGACAGSSWVSCSSSSSSSWRLPSAWSLCFSVCHMLDHCHLSTRWRVDSFWML